ncbi:Uncharacterised protein [Mycobacteroides abscessus subsp. abscessus]|uniref:Uncharacterized protein n=1 Tax=Mycobacteroides abscessus subsp. bolletii 50594 TaxID=1303024 RepID=A0AB33A7G1_9MYCO|nr:hypothetical protein [Mycobacteroides abscessus]AGM27614.1 hypothetical protein MASS_1012 [Mycobacteroides abscessus subsp. bolletii 50594]NOS00012.1 hypothetical protein [Mycobacteroides abscessus]PVA20654.1 hypothetical protein DDJ52_15585 [Mycobacteroides abscessus]RIR29698.1 hypothetical protein D2E28_05420 [Mycobacteroides abscessus]SIL14293.1 Uncharacterised protein [Mycobacteroides abscessus subsp. abscessus]
MFDEERWAAAVVKVQEGVDRNIGLFDEARAQADTIKPGVRVIRPFTATVNSVVAADGGHAPIEAFPFMSLGAVRVVDSSGEELFFDVIGPRDDTDKLSQRHIDERTPLGQLMADLGNAADSDPVRTARRKGRTGPLMLSELSPMIPAPVRGGQRPKKPLSNGWMTVYRDLCEWAAIYNLVCYRDPTDRMSVILRDGLLRSKIFAHDYFTLMGAIINERIGQVKQRRKRDIFLVGIAKSSEVQARYALAMTLQNIFPAGQPYFAPIPMALQEAVYQWPEYIRLPDGVDKSKGTDTPSMEDPKFNIGAMHFARFGGEADDPVWTLDTLHWQADRAAEILGCLLRDTEQSFPIPSYPQTLIDADAGAQISKMDAELLRDAFLDSIGARVDPAQRTVLDSQVLTVDYASRRYST